MPLELESLTKAIEALQRSLAAAKTATLSDDLREAVRSGVIQNFEVCYEQCWKFVQRWIRENRRAEDADFPRTRKELFRSAARYGLISDPLPWFDFGDARNQTSHAYDEKLAAAVYQAAERFLPHARELLSRLEARND